MWKILLKTVPVNLRRDMGTYILMGLLVAVGMYIAAASAGLTYSYYMAYEENDRISNSEDGQFEMMEPLNTQQEQAIRQRGYTLERAFSFDVVLDNKSVLRVMKPRQSIDRIMLDNFSPADTRKAVEIIGGRFETESSGGITFDTLRDYAECGVDFISVGALTHSVKGLDMSFKAC
jgi:hypothetical protein